MTLTSRRSNPISSTGLVRASVAVLTGVLTAAVMPGPSATAVAVQVPRDPAATVADIRAATTATRAAALATGLHQTARSTASTDAVYYRQTTFVVDAVTRRARKDVSFRPSAGSQSGRYDRFNRHLQCNPLRDESRGTTWIDQEELGRFMPTSGPYFRKGGALADRRLSPWALKTGFVSLRSHVDGQDGNRTEVLRELELHPARWRDASVEELPGGGRRHRLTYAMAALTSDDADGLSPVRLEVEIDADGRVTEIVRAQEEPHGVYTSRITNRFEPQRIDLPTDHSAWEPLKNACLAALARDAATVMPKQVAKRLNKKSRRPVTVAKTRNSLRNAADGTGLKKTALRVKARPSGAAITARHELLPKSVTRVVVVRDGRAVVRKKA